MIMGFSCAVVYVTLFVMRCFPIIPKFMCTIYSREGRIGQGPCPFVNSWTWINFLKIKNETYLVVNYLFSLLCLVGIVNWPHTLSARPFVRQQSQQSKTDNSPSSSSSFLVGQKKGSFYRTSAVSQYCTIICRWIDLLYSMRWKKGLFNQWCSGQSVSIFRRANRNWLI